MIYTEELQEIEEFYDSYINKVVELMNYYRCKTPLEVFSLFNLLCDYYIDDESINKTYLVDEPITPDWMEERPFLGIQVLFNGGVCRHKSAMLCDIYKKMNIDSIMLLGYSEDFLKFTFGREEKLMYDKLYISKVLRKISEGAKITDFKRQFDKRKITYEIKDVHDEYFTLNQKKVNHVIVMTADDKRYYLDPTRDTMYYKKEEDHITLKNNIGNYFFVCITMYPFTYGPYINTQEYYDTYRKLLTKECGNEIEDNRLYNELLNYYFRHHLELRKFVQDTEEDIIKIKEKSLKIK